jgi:DNA-binding transcriptional MerR regulator
MKNDVLTLADVVRKAGVSEKTVAGWLKAKLLRPAGFADDKTPLFAAGALDRIAAIRKLEELGYGPDAIQKIVKKVGFPQEKALGKGAPDKDRFLTVGNLAERSGVSPRTIKHWEDKGIIEPDMRTEGGFRLYSGAYVFVCKLIRDLQLFGYTLEEIKTVSDDVRVLLAIEENLNAFPRPEVEAKLASMLTEIHGLFDKIKLLKEGIDRWEDLLKKKKKDIASLRAKNEKRGKTAGKGGHA